MAARQERSYSVRFSRPFLGPLRRSGKVPQEGLDRLEALDVEDRLPVSVVHQMLEAAVEATGNPDLGLEAAREFSLGDSGAIDYVVSTAATVRGAIEVAARYMRLVNDSLNLKVEESADRVIVRFESNGKLPRAAADFQMGAFYRVHSRAWSRVAGAKLSVYFTHARPANVAEYERTFEQATLRFDAPFDGFVLEGPSLDAPLESADPRLHEVIRKHAELVLAELPKADSVTERVRAVVANELPSGAPGIVSVALKLHMSPRTLERRLKGENTTFSALLEELRMQLAFRYVGDSDVDLAEVALLLGFSQTSAFHRAFKRWTGQTPLHYRRAQRLA